MKRVIAVVFALFGFAGQAFGSCDIWLDCPIDGSRMMIGKCEKNWSNDTETCYYSHVAADGSTHGFYKTGCR